MATLFILDRLKQMKCDNLLNSFIRNCENQKIRELKHIHERTTHLHLRLPAFWYSFAFISWERKITFPCSMFSTCSLFLICPGFYFSQNWTKHIQYWQWSHNICATDESESTILYFSVFDFVINSIFLHVMCYCI